MIRALLLVILVSLAGCLNLYRDASRATYSDIADEFSALMEQLDAEAAACGTDECIADVEDRRQRARALHDEATRLRSDSESLGSDENQRFLSGIGALQEIWLDASEGLLTAIQGVRSAARELASLDGRLLDVGWGTAAAQDLLSLGTETSTDRLIAERERAAQTLQYLGAELLAESSRFVARMEATALEQTQRDVWRRLEIDYGISIQSAINGISYDVEALIADRRVYTGLGTSTPDEQFLEASRRNLMSTDPYEPGILLLLDRVEGTLTGVADGLAQAELDMASRLGGARNVYQALTGILGELQGMRSESVSNCLAIQ